MIGAPMAHADVLPTDRPRGLRRVRVLWRLFRNEREDPEPFYTLLAAEVIDGLAQRYGSLAGARVLDMGCGPGWYADALRRAGATVVALEGDPCELDRPGGGRCTGAVLGDATRTPLREAWADGILCSNMLEHTPDTEAVLREIGRVLRPGGWAYVSWTNWYSPWGGHDMTPWHLLGPTLGPRLYEKLHGPPRKNRAGEGLFPVHIGATLALVDAIPELELEQVEPRYWPWARFVTRIPGAREVLTWNCVLRLRRADEEPEFERTWCSLADVEGWLSVDQAQRLWRRAGDVPAGGRIVEIGSYHGRSAIVAAKAARLGVEVLAIDPHAGNDRGPQQWHGTAQDGRADHEAFLANLRAAGVADRVRHVREFSHRALDAVREPIDLLYVDGAHRYGPARDDLRQWGAKVRDGGTMLVHDSFSSVGVTLALLRCTFFGARWRYVGRSRSMVEYVADPVRGVERVRNAARQAAELPWFVRNLVIKLLIVARLGPLTRLLGHRDDTWPY